MANRVPETLTGFPTLPSSSARDPLPRSRWWTQLYSLFLRRKQLTKEESWALKKPSLYGFLTLIALFIIFACFIFFPEKPIHCGNFSIRSITVSSSSSALWHVDFVVENHSSRCVINYDGDDVYAKVGSLNAAVLKTSHMQSSRGYESFSVDFVTSNQSDVMVAASPRVFDLDMKLTGKRKIPLEPDENGHVDIRCENVMIGQDVNVKCHSTFKELKVCCKVNEVGRSSLLN